MSYDPLVNKDEILIRVTQYELYRDDYRIIIDCGEVLAGECKYRFTASAYLGFPSQTKPEFIVGGDTEDEALRSVLAKIKDVSVDNISNPPEVGS